MPHFGKGFGKISLINRFVHVEYEGIGHRRAVEWRCAKNAGISQCPRYRPLTKPAIAKTLPNDEKTEGLLLIVSAAPAKRGHLRPGKLPVLQACFLVLQAFSASASLLTLSTS